MDKSALLREIERIIRVAQALDKAGIRLRLNGKPLPSLAKRLEQLRSALARGKPESGNAAAMIDALYKLARVAELQGRTNVRLEPNYAALKGIPFKSSTIVIEDEFKPRETGPSSRTGARVVAKKRTRPRKPSYEVTPELLALYLTDIKEREDEDTLLNREFLRANRPAREKLLATLKDIFKSVIKRYIKLRTEKAFRTRFNKLAKGLRSATLTDSWIEKNAGSYKEAKKARRKFEELFVAARSLKKQYDGRRALEKEMPAFTVPELRTVWLVNEGTKRFWEGQMETWTWDDLHDPEPAPIKRRIYKPKRRK